MIISQMKKRTEIFKKKKKWFQWNVENINSYHCYIYIKKQKNYIYAFQIVFLMAIRWHN